MPPNKLLAPRGTGKGVILAVSGETEASVSGWTTDTLREHFTQQLTMRYDALRQELADSRDALNGKVIDSREYARLQFSDQQASLHRQFDDLQAAHRQQITDMRALLDERFTTQTTALNAAFKAAEQAVAVALANAEKATDKAEDAAGERFKAVNEFRKTLSDQTATFLPRAEYDATAKAQADRITANSDRMAALELRLTSRLDRGEGSAEGTATFKAERRLDSGQVLQALVVVIMAISLLIVAFHH